MSYSQKKLALIKEEYLTARPRVMLNRAISFFPAFREIGFLNLNGECVPFPDALPERSGTNITKTTGKSILRSYYCKIIQITHKFPIYSEEHMHTWCWHKNHQNEFNHKQGTYRQKNLVDKQWVTQAIAKTANLMPVVFHLHLKMSSFVPKSMIDINKKELSFVVSNDQMHQCSPVIYSYIQQFK